MKKYYDQLTNNEKLIIIKAYQKCSKVRPLTCWKHSDLQLEPKLIGEILFLECEKCGYQQTWIPEFVFEISAALNLV